MRDSFKVIDADRHVVEPRDLWERYLEEPWKAQAPRWLGEGCIAAEVGGAPIAASAGGALRALETGERFREARAANFSARSNLQDMDREGIDVAVLFPSAGLYTIWGDHVEAKLAAALCRAYNNWLRDYCQADPARLRGLGMVPLQDPAEAEQELVRLAELGFAGVVLRPNPLRKRQLSHRDYWPFYRAAEKREMSLWIHAGPGTVLPEIGVKDITGLEHPEGVVRFEGAYAQAAISPPFEIMGAMISLAGEEPLQEFPGLKVVFAGAGCGWLHFWADRLDDDYFHRGEDAPTRLKPGHYVARQTYVVARAHERMVPDLAGEFRDNLLWGSEYPHPELVEFPDELEPLVKNAGVPEATRRRILWDNAAKLLKLS